MPHEDPTPAPDDARADVVRAWERALADATPAERRDALKRLMSAATDAAERSMETPPPSRRRPRRSDVATYRVRVELDGTTPALWRRLDLASDLFLDDVHDILQEAFGWTDSHLHRFAIGPSRDSRDLEHYLCPFDVEEGDVGVPEHEVRLDEVLVDEGDRLYYDYDYGDNWQHTITLEAVVDRDGHAPRAVCTGGRRPGPPEDCGGVHSYQTIVAAQDPTHPDHADATAEFVHIYGDEIEPDMFDPVPFDIDETNAALTALGLDDGKRPDPLPGPLAELVTAVGFTPVKRRLKRLIARARLDEPVQVDAETAARMVHAHTWLLRRVGANGIKLTNAGYLPPVHVAAAFTELGLEDEWIGKGNREDLTLPVLNLRETAQRAGLLRKHRGRLLLTARGRAVVDDPVALWWQLAERTPPRSSAAHETQAGLVLLLAVAVNITDVDEADDVIAAVLDAIGWTASDGSPLTPIAAAHSAWNTRAVLRRLGGFADADQLGRRAEPTPDGVTFARAALQTW